MSGVAGGNGQVTGFVYATDPDGFGVTYRVNTGVDLYATNGTPVYAAADGVWHPRLNIYTGYAHMSRTIINNGQGVARVRGTPATRAPSSPQEPAGLTCASRCSRRIPTSATATRAASIRLPTFVDGPGSHPPPEDRP